MPRPLYIYKSVVEQNLSVTRSKINKLLGEIVEVSDKAQKCLAECIKLLTLTTADMASSADVHIVDLGVRTWNDFKVTSELTKMGFYLQATMVLRDILETMALTEYLHSFPEEADAWWKAKTKKERLRFSLNTIKDKIEDGQDLKESWETLSSWIHPNSTAVAIYGADKPYYGHDLFLNGFYYPSSVSFLFTLQLDLCIVFLKRLKDWYGTELEFSNELLQEINSLEAEYHTQEDYLKKRTESEEKEVVDKVVATRLSKDEVIEWFKSLENSS